MADDYTPMTETVRERFADGFPREGYAQALAYFDRWLAAHDAEKRAEWEAEQGTEEPEWEYAWEADEAKRTMTRPRGPRILFDGMVYPPETIALFARGRRIRRRKAGPWVPVVQGDT